MAHWRLLAAATGCAVCLGAGGARQDSSQQPQQFRSGVELVQVDVSVLDRDRRPLRGLTASDFSVLEDGVPQAVASFAEVAVAEPPDDQAAWVRDIAPDVRTNTAGADRLLALVLDDAQVDNNPRLTFAVKEVGQRVIDRLGPADLAAVVFTKDNSGTQPFTSDRAALLKAVASFHPGRERAAGPRDWSGQYFERATLDTLEIVAGHLATARERRKAIIYVSPGVGVDGTDGVRLQDVREILRNAQRGNVNVYCIDPTGLQTVTDGILSTGELFAADKALYSPSREFLRALASDTGGIAITDRNDFLEGVTQIFRENGSYYVIGYQSSNPARDGKFRKISIQVGRPGVTVRARSGYQASRDEKRADPGPSSAEHLKSLSAVAPEGGVAMLLTAAPFAMPGKKEAALAVVLGIRQPPLSQADRAFAHDVFVGAYGPDGGRPVASRRLKAEVQIRPGMKDPVPYELLGLLNLKPGRYQLRVAALAAVEGNIGSIHFDVDVPDFSKAPLSLSGIVLTATPSGVIAPRDAFEALLPIVPTTRRDFFRGDRASAFLRVYHGARQTPAAVAMFARIVNAAGAMAFETREAVPADQFGAGRTADYGVDLPIERLVPGHYLLSVEATLGKNTARRDLRFTVH